MRIARTGPLSRSRRCYGSPRARCIWLIVPVAAGRNAVRLEWSLPRTPRPCYQHCGVRFASADDIESTCMAVLHAVAWQMRCYRSSCMQHANTQAPMRYPPVLISGLSFKYNTVTTRVYEAVLRIPGKNTCFKMQKRLLGEHESRPDPFAEKLPDRSVTYTAASSCHA